jgi:hypothetical protein
VAKTIWQALIVLVRGLFGSFMPRNFLAVADRLFGLGARVIRSRIQTTGKVEDNAKQLQQLVPRILKSDEEVLFMCPSKGSP